MNINDLKKRAGMTCNESFDPVRYFDVYEPRAILSSSKYKELLTMFNISDDALGFSFDKDDKQIMNIVTKNKIYHINLKTGSATTEHFFSKWS